MNQEGVKRMRGYLRHSIRQTVHAKFTEVLIPSEAAAEHGQNHVVDMKIRNEKEKKEMQDLNSKLANHLEKTRRLEAENKHLKEHLGKSKIEFNVEVIKISHQEQLDDLKGILEKKDKELADTKSQKESLEELVEDLREQMHQLEDERDRLRTELETSHNEVARSAADVKRCNQKTGALEKQLADSKTRNGILLGQLTELRTKLQSETTQRLNLASRLEMLEKELDFNIDRHNTEVKEYQAMLSKSEKIPDFQESWEAEIGTMISDLSAGHDAELERITTEMEERYAAEIQLLKSSAKPSSDVVDADDMKKVNKDMKTKISEYKTKISNMKKKITDLQSLLDESKSGRASDAASYQTELNRKCEKLMKELLDASNAKLSLELEIGTYRRLLDGEESRMGTKAVVTVLGGFQTEAEAALSNALASASKMTMSHSTTGRVSVIELATDGKYIKLEDLSKFPKGAANIKNWTLTQTLENGKKYTHTFTDGNVFSSGKIVKIWGSKHGAGQDGITSPTVEEWASMVMPSTITLTDDQQKQSASTVIKINA